MTHLELQLYGFRLATAEILYRMPDHPVLLQSYIWQEYDQVPEFPALKKFLVFWEKNLDGQLYSVKVSSVEVVRPYEVIYTPHDLRLH